MLLRTPLKHSKQKLIPDFVHVSLKFLFKLKKVVIWDLAKSIDYSSPGILKHNLHFHIYNLKRKLTILRDRFLQALLESNPPK